MRLAVRNHCGIFAHSCEDNSLASHVSALIIISTLLLAVASMAGGCASSESGQSEQSKSSGPDEFPSMADNYFDLGRRAYLDNCSRCHGIRVQQVHKWLAAQPFSSFHIKSLIRNGSQVMQPIPDYVLDDYTMNQLIEYLRIVRRTSELDTSATAERFRQY